MTQSEKQSPSETQTDVPFSLQHRLQLFLGSALVLVFLGQWVLAVWILDYTTDRYVISRLQHDIQSVVSALSEDANGELSLDQSRLGLLGQPGFSGHYYHLKTDDKAFASPLLKDDTLTLSFREGDKAQWWEHFEANGVRLMVYQESQEYKGKVFKILVAENIQLLFSTMAWFTWGYAFFSLLLLLVFLYLQTRFIRLLFRPLQHLRTEVSALMHQGQGASLVSPVPLEIQPLVGAFNALLDVLNTRLLRSRNALGDLAHALKKPLALIHQLQDQPVTDDSQRLLREQLARIEELVNYELKRARMAGVGPVKEPVDLCVELPFVVRLLEHTYASKNLQVRWNLPKSHTFYGDRQDLLELCGNILDNAFKWAHQTIQITLNAESGLHLCIEDDGPGCSSSEKTHLLQRGVRFDQQTPGHGLGLSIAKEIVAIYNGELILKDSKLGGLKVEICIL